jgi:hypothetical protein
MLQSLSDYYRVPDGLLDGLTGSVASGDLGFFSFGPETICFGQCESGVSATIEDASSHDASKHVRFSESEIQLPFDPDQLIENMRREKYVAKLVPGRERMISRGATLKVYYFFRSLLPVPIRRHLQRAYFSDWKKRPFPRWPVDQTVDTLHQDFLRLSLRAAGAKRIPFIWFWPEGAPNCLLMTHDVETRAGRDFTSQLMDIDDSYGLKASFQVIPEDRYEISDEYVKEIRGRGFEFNIHDLNHDGNLYRKKEEFLGRAKKINEYGHLHRARGFRAGSMYRRLDWYDAFEFSYDMSLTNVAHLEPKRGGCCTLFPFFVGKILELPLTTSQDYSVLHILNDYSIALWKQQLELIGQANGLMSFIAHPDYLIDSRARKVYEALLDYLRELIAARKIWAPLPGDVDLWWRARSRMKLVPANGGWEIRGPESERARIAYAFLDGDQLRYEVTTSRHTQNPQKSFQC